MTELSKTIFNLSLSTATLFVTAFLWSEPAWLSVALFTLGIAMMFVEGSKSTIIIYLIAFIFGPLSEAIAIYFGAWSYTTPQIFGFPAWLPFVWGNAALFVNRLIIYIRYMFSYLN